MSELLTYLSEHKQEILADIEILVKAESPSHVKEQVDRCGSAIQALFKKHLNAIPEIYPQEETGNHFSYTFGSGDSQILILSHFDTVWDMGRLSYRVEGNRAYGPGILDMKGGLVQALWAMKACKELGIAFNKKIVFLCTSDEEIGSSSSRKLIEEEALKSDAVLVTEPAVAHSGALKTARKGVGDFTISIHGKASHAGNHHESGISAVEEMARQILFVHSLTDYEKGSTLNAGIARGGNRTNVIAEYAEIEVDLRVTSLKEAERISGLLFGIKPHRAGVSIQVSGGINRPPMERTAQTEQLFNLAKSCADELGFHLSEEAVGGGSDGNFTAALGIPTLDGLGSVGDGPHAEYEHIEIDQIPVRSALFATLLSKL